ncbi:potassium channel family protein [Candidatus Borrarchaeum sp.]|uniref:potassium channel family protein n=1 Tax=Candidatus Borrarchaeum sp. TaxID=2846742 RepID=UPI002580DAF9|nr:potassium channel family protein [Candidatus Borrarchaeum sp.]
MIVVIIGHLKRAVRKFTKTDFFKAFIYIIVAVSIATIGFSYLEGRSLADSFYWAVITLTTVGYGDITPATSAGRIFVVFVSILGIGMVAIFAGTFASYLIGIQPEREMRRLKKMTDIVLICGYNEKIKNFLKEIDINSKESKDMVCIAPLEERPEDLPESIVFISGKPYEDKFLLKAKIFDVTEAIISLDHDQDAILTALAIGGLNRKTEIICNVIREENVKHLYKIGVKKVLCDETVGGQMLASMYKEEATFEILHHA